MVARRLGDESEAELARAELLAIDPIHHFALAERYLAEPADEHRRALTDAMGGEYPEQTLLELAVGYANRGLAEDALAVLRLADQVGGGMPSAGVEAASGDGEARSPAGPLMAAWRGFLTGDASALGTPAGDALAFVFPFRAETLPVLRWAAEESGHWSWRYLLGLNLWALDRDREAAEMFAALGDEPDYGAAYAARGYLLQQVQGRDAGADLARAAELDPDDRVLRVALVRHTQEARAWDEAVQLSARAREDFPGDFDVALLHVRSLLHLGEHLEATEVLASTHVLPSENARDSHRLHELAHVGAALDELDAARSGDAREHLEAALLWPESLGQGRPYEPDERLVRLVMDLAAAPEGGRAQAERGAWLAEAEALLDEASPRPLGPPDDLTLLARQLVRRAIRTARASGAGG